MCVKPQSALIAHLIKRKFFFICAFNVYLQIRLSSKSPETRTWDTKDTRIRVSDTDTATPRIRTRRTRYIYTYI